MRKSVWLLLAAVACSPSLPSAEPLGSGPMADRGDAAVVATADAGAKQEDASAQATATAPPVPSEPPAAVSAADAGRAPEASPGPATTASDAGSSPSSATASVAGEYVGWDTTSYNVPNVPGAPQKDPNARTRVVKGAGDAIEIVIINSANGQDLCNVKGRLKAGVATIDKGQRCFEEDGGMMTATLRKGTGKFSGRQLILDMEFDLTIDTGQDELRGDIVYHFEGNRK